MAEAEDLKSSQCGFDPHSGHSCIQFRFPIGSIAHGVLPWVAKSMTKCLGTHHWYRKTKWVN